ncbi:MAG TPA: WD40 repeat domain-containing protein, partial [Candidatus Sericytochromatia bacterium]
TISAIANISSDSTSQYVKHLVRSLKKGEFQQLIAPIAAWSQANPQVKLLMIIDQFEELITMSRKANPANLDTKSDSIKQKPQDWLSNFFSRQSTAKNNNQTAQKDEIQQEWQQFLVLLINTLKNCPQLHIVLTLRSDFEARFVESVLKEYWDKARFPVRAMRSDELREAIEKPASEMALYFEPANAVDRLIDEVGEMPGALPLLSFTLSELYIKLHNAWREKVKEDRALTIDEQFYQQGGIASSLSYKTNKIYEDLSDDAKATMRRVMLRMVEIRGGEAVRRQVFLESELVYTDGQENDRVSQVIKSLIDARLIVTGGKNQESYVEPAHDFLVRGWDKLEEWIKQEETHLILQRELTLDANKWIDDRAVGLLWDDDPRLPFVNKIFESDRHWFNQLETEFIIKSLDRKWNKRLQLIGFIASFIGLVSTAAIIAFIQWGLAEQRRIEAEQKTRIATSRQLAAQSQAVFKQYPQRSLLLAVEALKITQDKGDPRITAAEQILRDGLSQSGGQLLKGHTAGINAVAVSPDSRWLATASEDKTVRLWDLKAKNPAQAPIILHHLGEVRTVAISNDGRWLATGGSDQTVRLWNLSAKDPTVRPRLLKHDHYIWKIAFSPDNHWLVTGTGISGGGTVRLWDLAAKTPEATSLVLYRGKDTILDVTFSKNNRWLAIVNEEKNVYLWDLNAKKLTLAPITLAGHQRSVQAVDFSYDSRWLATASEDNTVRLWNLSAKNPAANSITLYGDNQALFRFIRFSRDNKWLVAAGQDNTAYLWNVKAKDPASALVVLRGHENAISDIAFSFDSHWLVTSSDDKTARMWNLTAENPAAKPITLHGHDASISAITFSPNGRWLITASSGNFLTDDNSVRLWDLTRNGLFEIPLALQGLKDDILSSTISSDNRWLVTKHSDLVTRIWDLSLKQRTHIPVRFIDSRQGQQDFGYPTAISSDKRWLVTVSKDKVTRLWDLNFKNPLESDLFKYDLCAYPYQNCLLFYTLYDKLETNELSTFTSDNRWLVTCNGRNCHLWDLTAKQPTANPTVFSNEAEIEAVAFSPNGRWLITGTHLWDLTAKNLAAKPIILTGGVRSVAFSSDGRWLVTGSRDKNVRLWDLTIPDPAAAPIILSAHSDVVRVV